jgi:O-antigen ligase
MVVLVPIALERFFHEKKNRYKIIALYTALVAILCVLLTYSRGGFLALAVALAVYFYYYPPKRIQVPIIIVAGLIFVALAPPRYFERILTLTEFLQPRNTLRTEERSFQGRLSENLAGWEMIKSNPLFGVGLRSYNYLFPIYSKNLGLALVAGEREAHNLYLEITAETGIVGLAIFSLVIYTSMKIMLLARKRFVLQNLPEFAGMITGYMAGFVGYMFAALFIHGAYPRYLYLLIGIAMSMQLASQSEAARENKAG